MTPAELTARGGLKWNYHPDDVLAAWVAEMDFGLAPAIAAALHAAVDRGEVGYPYPDLVARTAGAACSFWAERFGWEVDQGRVYQAPDVVEGIRRAIVHLTPPGAAVVLHTPVYFPFFSMIERAGRRLVEIPCEPDADGRYVLDLDAIARAFDEGAGSVVLCNPWNPTGRAFSAAEVEDLIEVVASRGGRVISDEVHAALTGSGLDHTVAASVDPDTVVTVTSASKAWNIPGVKCAEVVLTRDEDAEKWSTYFTPDKVGVSPLGLVANAAAYTEGREWLDEVVTLLDANRRLLAELLPAHLPDVRFGPLEATYLAWLDFRGYGLDRPADHLLEHARVALTGGDPFGVGGRGHARLNFGTPAPILAEIIERIGKALG